MCCKHVFIYPVEDKFCVLFDFKNKKKRLIILSFFPAKKWGKTMKSVENCRLGMHSQNNNKQEKTMLFLSEIDTVSITERKSK